MENRCPECGDKIVGRSDKKFCSDQCRNSYNNRKNKDSSKLLRDVNNILQKNHRILTELTVLGQKKIHRDKLLTKGFNFDFITSVCTSRTNIVYYYCYDQGFYKLDEEYYGIVKNEGYLDNLV